MEYSKEHISKCAGCPDAKKCALIGCSFEVREMYCKRLRGDKPTMETLINQIPRHLAACYIQSIAFRNSIKDFSKHYSPEAIALGKREYDRYKNPTYYLSKEAEDQLYKSVGLN